MYLFAGEQYDPALGLYYNRARYLNTTTGRFWSMDTYEGQTTAPLSLHKYLYASGSPVGRVDPSGHDDLTEVMAVAAISITLATMACTTMPKWVLVSVDFDLHGSDWDLGLPITEPEKMTIKTEVFQTLLDAYRGFEVFFSEGKGSHHQINIKPGLFGHVGETWPGQVVSQVYYDDEWNTLTSDSVLRCRGLDDCSVSRDVLIERLGVGLGATAAHELGHQGGLNFVTDIPCDSCYDSNTAASRAHFFQPLHWSDACLARMEKVLPGGGPNQ